MDFEFFRIHPIQLTVQQRLASVCRELADLLRREIHRVQIRFRAIEDAFAVRGKLWVFFVFATLRDLFALSIGMHDEQIAILGR